MNFQELKDFLDKKVSAFNTTEFISADPISIPHRFTRLQDIEIIGFWTAILSWGQRKTIINKAMELCKLMDFAPYDFIVNHTDSDLKNISQFKHRTFNADDTLCFVAFFQWFYKQFDSLEDAFLYDYAGNNYDIKNGISNFHKLFISAPDFLPRTRKHIASPLRNSACKRINMFLRWMVRKDIYGVDFGLWNRISPANLMIPLDVHVFRIATKLGLIERKSPDWKAVEELTEKLRKFDPKDPIKYDFALFGLGVLEKDQFL